ncbi:uncharacterized protein [Rutidosis leptorrhynchoides]|uniref:uncharacterized protein n=1 Tax=Rutidosis leptorrhynchoides TaxID=125765 RepID=UPI003A99CD97
MAPEKVTEMVLNVDLKCSHCYKKVKKVICKIPQIRDQVFDVEKNKVKIMVVCCSPEKIRDKLCYKGNGAIQSIEIVEKADKPKEADKPKPPGDKPKEADKPKPAGDKPKEADKPKPAGDKPKESAPKPKPAAADKPKEPEKPKPAAADKPKDSGKPKEPEKPKPAEKPKEPEKPKPADKPKDSGKPAEPAKPKEGDKPPAGPPKKPDAGPNPDQVAKMVYEPVHGYPQMYPPSGYPMTGYGQYYDQGYGGAAFQHGYGMPVAAPPASYVGYGYGYDNGYNNGYNGNRGHHEYYGGHEEDGEGCSVM